MSADTLAMELKLLKDLDRDELLERWKALYEREPPSSISKPLLIHSIAYRMQEKALGGLRPATRRFLTQFPTGKHQPVYTTNLRIGTRLLREWHGTVYEVTILERGVLFNGREYRSLTEVATVITGTQWSGPAFFGLRKSNQQRYEQSTALRDIHS